MKPEWVNGEGWTSELVLSKHISLFVSKGMMRDSKFYFACLGVRTKEMFDTSEQAQKSALNFATKQIIEATQTIVEIGSIK